MPPRMSCTWSADSKWKRERAQVEQCCEAADWVAQGSLSASQRLERRLSRTEALDWRTQSCLDCSTMQDNRPHNMCSMARGLRPLQHLSLHPGPLARLTETVRGQTARMLCRMHCSHLGPCWKEAPQVFAHRQRPDTHHSARFIQQLELWELGEWRLHQHEEHIDMTSVSALRQRQQLLRCQRAACDWLPMRTR